MFPCGMKHAGSGQQMPTASAAAPIGTCNGFSTVDCLELSMSSCQMEQFTGEHMGGTVGGQGRL
jgi:hypothetical protein